MKPFIRWSVVGLLCLGCSGEQVSPSAETARAGLSEREYFSDPSSVSPDPVPFSTFEGPLWPEGKRVVVLSAGYDGKEGAFIAYGVDVGEQQVRYVIAGRGDEYPRFAERLAAELLLGDVGRCRIGLGQVPIPLPPPVNPDGEPFSEVFRRAALVAADACP